MTPVAAESREARAGRSIRWLVAVLVGLLVLALWLGSSGIHPQTTGRILLSALGLGDVSDIPRSEQQIILLLRMPRAVLLMLVGGALAISGAALQATFQNPLADPAILGVSGGGALGAVLAIYSGVGEVFLVLPLCAFAGAFGSSVLVFLLSHLGARPSTTSLLLTGVALGSLTGAGVSLVMLWTEEYRIRTVLFWLVGTAQDRSWSHVQACVLPILIGTMLLWLRHRWIDALSLGEEHALSVGLPVVAARLWLLVLCALVAGAAVSVSGTIAFVGLMVPHILRLCIGSQARWLLPASFLGGAVFLLACDLVSSQISDTKQVPLGIVTSVLGVPYFLWLLRRGRMFAT
jgi:iron complex transport system permease protein